MIVMMTMMIATTLTGPGGTPSGSVLVCWGRSLKTTRGVFCPFVFLAVASSVERLISNYACLAARFCLCLKGSASMASVPFILVHFPVNWRTADLRETPRSPHIDQQTLRSAAKSVRAKTKHQCPTKEQRNKHLRVTNLREHRLHTELSQPRSANFEKREAKDQPSSPPKLAESPHSKLYPIVQRYTQCKQGHTAKRGPASLYKRKVGKRRETCKPSPQARP